MRKNFPFLISALLTYVLFISCRRPTDSFERKNIKDPVNAEYITGSASELNILFNNEGIITITWADTALYEDGFIIEKSLVDTLSFTEIGRVRENITVYQDSSKAVRKNTFYKVTAFTEKDSGIDKFESSVQQMKEFGSITTFDFNYESNSKALNLNWENNSPFTIKFKLQYKKKNQQEFTVIEKFDSATNTFTEELSDISFDDRTYKLSLLLTGKGFEEEIDHEVITFQTDFFVPSDLTVNIQDEQTINLSWKDNSYFEKGYKIFRSSSQNGDQMELIESVPANSTEYQDKLNLKNGTNYTYKVVGYTGNSESDSLIQRKVYSIPTPYLINDKFTNTASNSIKLSWLIEEDEWVNEYILERKRFTNDPWVEVGRFDKTTKTFTDMGVDPAYSYIYRIRTLSSDYSDELEMFYRPLFSKVATFTGHSRGISDLDFSPDGNYLASSSNYALGYGDTFVLIWDLDTNQLYKKIGNHEEPITSVDFSPDGTMLSSSSWFDATVNIFEFPSGNLIRSFSGVSAYDAKFSPDSKFIAATGGFADVRKWEISTGNLIFLYEGRGSPASTPHSLAFKPDGSEIAVDDKSMAILDASTGKRIRHLDTEYNYAYLGNNLSYSRDGSRLVYTLNWLQVYETTSWTKLFQSGNHYKYPSFNPNNNDIVAGAGGNIIRFRNIESRLIVNKLTASSTITYFTFSPDGSMIATGLENGSIELWELMGQKVWKTIY